MPKKIKICGLRSIDDINIVNNLLPDFIGFIFYKKSKRYIEPTKAKELNESLDKNIKSVGVFVNEEIETVIKISNLVNLNIIQLHGNESEEYINKLNTLTNKEIIKVYRVKDNITFSEVDVTYYLFDTFVENYGGEGKVFDWSKIEDIDTSKRVILAGGINIDNIDKALRTKADIIDLSSAVEIEGKKDYKLVKQVIEAVRRF